MKFAIKIELYIFILICFVIIGLVFNGCTYKEYKGEYPDLYTVAINSILWNNGHSYGADKAVDSNIEVIETDEYGRILFSYYEKYYAGARLSFSALIVMQYSSEDFVYYYEDENYLICEQELFATELKVFTQENKDYLKSKNDWGKEINLKQCTKKNIEKTKQEIPCENKIIKENIVEHFELYGDSYNLFFDYLTSDAENNFIAYGSVIRVEGEIYFALLVKTVESEIKKISFFVPSNLYEYGNEFIEFKNVNGWIY